MKQVVGYAGFRSYGDKPYSSMKAGQFSMEREYYDKATQEKPDGSKCLANYKRFGSDYGDRISVNTKPGEYKVPLKDCNTLSKKPYFLIVFS